MGSHSERGFEAEVRKDEVLKSNLYHNAKQRRVKENITDKQDSYTDCREDQKTAVKT